MHNYLRPTVCFDVDNCIIDSDGNPRDEVIQFLKLFQRFGCDVIVWSNGNNHEFEDLVKYAMSVCRRLNIVNVRVIEKGSIQPDLCIDDLSIWDRISEGTLGRVNIRV